MRIAEIHFCKKPEIKMLNLNTSNVDISRSNLKYEAVMHNR